MSCRNTSLFQYDERGALEAWLVERILLRGDHMHPSREGGKAVAEVIDIEKLLRLQEEMLR
jgi:hypothetical protein